MSAPMPEITVEDLLTTAIKEIRTNPQLITDIFMGQPPQIYNDAYRFFTSKQQSINVGPFFAKQQNSLPYIAIQAGDGGSIDYYTGDYMGQELDDDGVTTLLLVGYRARGSVNIEIATGNNRQTSYLAAFVKWALIHYRNDLFAQRLDEPETSNQRVDIDASSIANLIIYVYTISVSFTFNIAAVERYGPTPSAISAVNLYKVDSDIGDESDDRDE